MLLKDKLDAKAPFPAAPQAVRPGTAYDQPAPVPNDTPIRLKVSKTVSSETAHLGDVVDILVAEDTVVDGLCGIVSGASAEGVVTEAEPTRPKNTANSAQAVPNPPSPDER